MNALEKDVLAKIALHIEMHTDALIQLTKTLQKMNLTITEIGKSTPDPKPKYCEVSGVKLDD